MAGFMRGQPRRTLFRAPFRQTSRSSRRTAARLAAAALGVEKKFYDTSFTEAALSVATDSTGGEYDPSATSMISTPAQGDGATNRDGKQIVAKYVEIKGFVRVPRLINQTAAATPYTAMLALVLDTQTNAAQAQSEQVFTNPAAAAGTAPDCLRNLEYGARFRILKQQHFTFPPLPSTYDGTNVEQAGYQKDFTWYVPLGDLKINFNSGTTASIANVIDNSLHMMGFGNSADISLSYNARLRFLG